MSAFLFFQLVCSIVVDFYRIEKFSTKKSKIVFCRFPEFKNHIRLAGSVLRPLNESNVWLGYRSTYFFSSTAKKVKKFLRILTIIQKQKYRKKVAQYRINLMKNAVLNEMATTHLQTSTNVRHVWTTCSCLLSVKLFVLVMLKSVLVAAVQVTTQATLKERERYLT